MSRVVLASLAEVDAHLKAWGGLSAVDTRKRSDRSVRSHIAHQDLIVARLRGRVRPPASALSPSVHASRVEVVLRILDEWSSLLAVVARAEYSIHSTLKVRLAWVCRAVGREVSRKEYGNALDHARTFIAARLRPVRSA